MFRTDEGGEFKVGTLVNHLKARGIKIEHSVPYKHQQNGHIERFNRTLQDKASSLHLDACLPNSWWEYAFMHASFLYNRTPVRHQKWKTPYELLNTDKPDISMQRIFGCGAYVHIPKEVRKWKFTPRGELMTFLSFTKGQKGYLFM